MKRWLLPFCVLLVLSAGCASGARGEGPSPGPTSGVRGVVTYGPLCPVVRAGSPCPDRPWQGTVQAFQPDGSTLVREAQTDQDGAFTLSLEPGAYVISPLTPDGPPTSKFRNVTVNSGSFVEVILQVDSGIR